jgi:hypothetical protein
MYVSIASGLAGSGAVGGFPLRSRREHTNHEAMSCTLAGAEGLHPMRPFYLFGFLPRKTREPSRLPFF